MLRAYRFRCIASLILLASLASLASAAPLRFKITLAKDTAPDGAEGRMLVLCPMLRGRRR